MDANDEVNLELIVREQEEEIDFLTTELSKYRSLLLKADETISRLQEESNDKLFKAS